ncbi:MAG: hypothetical protein Q7T61_18990 [Caulobacter sp.]|nr:hypothetical protein [Caulobacter sp.]
MSKSKPEARSWSPPREIDPDDLRQVRKLANRLDRDPADIADAAREFGGCGKAVLINLGRGDLLVEGGHGIS